MVAARIAQVESAADLSETAKLELLNLYRQAQDQLTLAAGFVAKTAELAKGREEAPALLEATRAKLDQLSAAPPAPARPDVPLDATLESLTQKLTQLEADLRSKQDAARKLDEEAKNRADRRTVIPDLLVDANKRLEKATQDLSAPAATGVSAQLVQARRMLLQAQRKAADAEVRSYEEELRFFDARAPYLAARRELAKLEVGQAQAAAQACQGIVSERRAAEIERQRIQTETELRTSPGPVRDLAETNAKLTEERADLASRIDSAKESAQRIKEVSDRLSKDFEYLRTNVKRKGMSDFIGPLMRKKRAELVEFRGLERELLANKQEYNRVLIRSMEIDEERDAIDTDGEVTRVMEALKSTRAVEFLTWIETRVRELLQTRRDLLDKLHQDYETYSSDLTNLSTAANGLATIIAGITDLINENVIWIPSTGPIYKARWPRDWDAMLQPWTKLVAALQLDALTNAPTYGLAAIAWMVLVWLRWRMLAALRDISQRVAKVFADAYTLTLKALVITVLLALPWPLLMGFAAWRCAVAVDVTDAEAFELARSVAAGLAASAWVLGIMMLLRGLCRPKGLGESHFRWEAGSLRLLRRHTLWAMAIAVPARFVVSMTEYHSSTEWRESVGRLAYLASMAVLAVFVQRVFRINGGLLSARFRKFKSGAAYHLRYVWYPALVAVPVALGAASALGYHYTAVTLTGRMMLTVRFLFAVIIIQAMAVRWLFMAQRKLAIEQARKKYAAAEKAAEASGGQAPPIDEEQLNLVTIGDQTRRIVRSVVAIALVLGLWISWADMLPALSFMNEVKLWSYTVEAAVVNGDAAAAGTVTERVEYVTVAQLGLALVIVTATLVLARNIPGVLEIAILQRLPLDSGSRYAFTTLSRYFITVFGVVVTFALIGVGWSQVQWLVAAITVGLGFGLQEIFANFISGLIILFERPIRVGDTVTIGGMSGTVARIRIRATTIIDWDRKEMIIPNKEFVTGQIVNWTLSDQVLRLVIKVGVAYGTDTRKVVDILLKVAAQNASVVDDPAPKALFLAFGDNALNFELRAYVRSLDDYMQAQHDLHTAVDDAFRKAGIEISFPQRDIHIRSIREALPIIRRDNPDIVADASADEAEPAAGAYAESR